MSGDLWASGEAYEPYVGRWSRVVAREFVDWLGVPPQADWIDVGCGTGALSAMVLEHASPHRVRAYDPSEAYVAYAREHVPDVRASFAVADALALPETGGAGDAAVAGLVLNFVPDAVRAVREMARGVRDGGTVAAYLWDYSDGMRMIRLFWDAAIELDPAARDLDEARRSPMARPEPFAALFRQAGVADVQVRSIDVTARFTDFDDLWTPFLGGQGPAPSYARSLDEPRRAALRANYRRRVPIAMNGSIELIARAWAVRGRPR